jgi:hypothetical protein
VADVVNDPELPAPGTLDDLFGDAREVGFVFNEPLARKWHAKGLLGSPAKAGLGQGRGSVPGLYSSEQRALFRAAARNAARGIRYPGLAAIPVWAWLNDSTNTVAWEQLRRALRTARGPVPQKSRRLAEQTARSLVDEVDFGAASVQSRAQLRNEMAAQLYAGRIDPNALRPKVAKVFEPEGLHVVRGPVGAQLDVDSFVYSLAARMLALSRKTWPDELLGTARLQHRVSWLEYQKRQPDLAARAGSLASRFATVALDDEVAGSVSTLVLLVGMQLQHQAAAGVGSGGQP